MARTSYVCCTKTGAEPRAARVAAHAPIAEPASSTSAAHDHGLRIHDRSDRAPDADDAAALVDAVVKCGFSSASAKAFALSKRSAGTFSRDFDTAAATFGGTDLRCCVTGAASSVTIFIMICCAEPPRCGGCPAS